MRARVWPVAAALGVGLVAGARLEPPQDVGTWSTEALPGEVVLALARDPAGGGVLVGTRTGLHRLHADGRLEGVGPTARVQALAVDGDRAWVGTDEGVLVLADGVLRPGAPGVPAAEVDALDVDLDAEGGRVLVASAAGVLEVTGDGTTRLWPPAGEQAVPVAAVLAVPSGVLLAAAEGLVRLAPDGGTTLVLPGADVLALGRLDRSGSVWAGTRGAPLLARSDDGGRTWSTRSEGLGFSAVNALASDPTRAGHHVVGGSGLADGTGNAGTQWSEDDARTWQVEQDRLSNTHVFAMAVTREPVRVSLGLPATTTSVSVPLPLTTPRWYAGTNGAGVATMRPDVPVLAWLVSVAPYLRVAEPLFLGAVVAVVLLPAYRTLARNRAAVRASPSSSTHPTEPDPDLSMTTEKETPHA